MITERRASWLRRALLIFLGAALLGIESPLGFGFLSLQDKGPSLMGLKPSRVHPISAATDTDSVCRGIVQIKTEPGPLRSCEPAHLVIGFQPICSDQRVHVVYAVNPSISADWALGLGPSVRSLNLGANPNIFVATLTVPGPGAMPILQPFSNDQTTVMRGIARMRSTEGLPPGQSPACAACSVREALALLRKHRGDVAPDEVSEFIAIWGIGDGDLQGGQAFRNALNEAKREGVSIISARRNEASSARRWTGGSEGLGPVFSRIAVDHNGTMLRDMDLTLHLPEGMSQVAHSAQPPGRALDERTIRWDDPPWTFEGITLTLDIDVLAAGQTAMDLPRLHARLESWRGRSRSLTLPDPSEMVIEDGCTQEVTPSPGVPGASPTPRPSRTPWPSPTFGPSPTAARERPAALFLPIIRQHRCRHPESDLDVALVLDASTSMEGLHLEAAVDASLGFLRALQSVEESERSGAERRVALIRFHGDAATLIPPSADLEAVAAILETMRADPMAFLAPGTRIDLGLAEGLAVLRDSAADASAPRQQALILLTDGLLSHRRYPDALEVAEEARESASIDLYAVGLGATFDARLLEEIVADPSRFAPAQDADALAKIYEELAARIVCAP